MLLKVGDRTIVRDANVLRRYAQLQRAIKAAQGAHLMPAQKIPVEFGEWRPDVALLDTKFAADVENVFAGVNSYLPFPSLLPFPISCCRRRRADCTRRAPAPASGASTPAPQPSCIAMPLRRLGGHHPHRRRRL